MAASQMHPPRFHQLRIARATPEAAGAVVLTFAVPPELHAAFQFLPGQFLTLRATVGGQSVRRSYSICSSLQRWEATRAIDVGIKPVAGGLFSGHAGTLQAGDLLDVMPPEGRFTPCPRIGLNGQRGVHRVGFAAGSGITPILSILASTLQQEPDSQFTLVYGNQHTSSILFNEALQDLKDQYPQRLTLIHILSRQAQEVPLLCGRIDEVKVHALLTTLLPVGRIDEAFVCGPEGMIEATTRVLMTAGLSAQTVHSERFFSPQNQIASNLIADTAYSTRANSQFSSELEPLFNLQVVIDGKTHALQMTAQQRVLDVALAAGLDLPYACRGGVCCTCRARVLEGKVTMDKNFTLEAWEMDKGFVLTCQARPMTPTITVSYDER